MKLTADQEERARRLHRQALVWDSHCDTLIDLSLIHISEPTRPY